MTKMKQTLTKKQLEAQVQTLEADRRRRLKKETSKRAVSISVGTAFGGTTEVNMRTDDGSSVWCYMQPVEVIEIIHQLAANVGCHVALKPRKDFASWRDWRVTDEEHERLQGWAPFVNDMAPYNQLGARGMDPEVVAALNAGAMLTEGSGGNAGQTADGSNSGAGQPGANVFVGVNNRSNTNETLAIKKPDNRRNTKRTAKVA